MLENDKRAYSEDSQGIIRKQRASIEKLTRENRGMKQVGYVYHRVFVFFHVF